MNKENDPTKREGRVVGTLFMNRPKEMVAQWFLSFSVSQNPLEGL